jgi:hypothetical protein
MALLRPAALSGKAGIASVIWHMRISPKSGTMSLTGAPVPCSQGKKPLRKLFAVAAICFTDMLSDMLELLKNRNRRAFSQFVHFDYQL